MLTIIGAVLGICTVILWLVWMLIPLHGGGGSERGINGQQLSNLRRPDATTMMHLGTFVAFSESRHSTQFVHPATTAALV